MQRWRSGGRRLGGRRCRRGGRNPWIRIGCVLPSRPSLPSPAHRRDGSSGGRGASSLARCRRGRPMRCLTRPFLASPALPLKAEEGNRGRPRRAHGRPCGRLVHMAYVRHPSPSAPESPRPSPTDRVCGGRGYPPPGPKGLGHPSAAGSCRGNGPYAHCACGPPFWEGGAHQKTWCCGREVGPPTARRGGLPSTSRLALARGAGRTPGPQVVPPGAPRPHATPSECMQLRLGSVGSLPMGRRT